METKSQLHELFRYDDWANRASLDSVVALTSPPQRAVEVIGHLVGAQWLWLRRLGLPSIPKMAVWPELSLEQSASELPQIADAWLNFIVQVSSEGMSNRVAYTNSKGEPWQSTRRDILTHVLFHSGYHRGQIAMLIGREGNVPAYTDYIHCTRQNLLNPLDNDQL